MVGVEEGEEVRAWVGGAAYVVPFVEEELCAEGETPAGSVGD